MELELSGREGGGVESTWSRSCLGGEEGGKKVHGVRAVWQARRGVESTWSQSCLGGEEGVESTWKRIWLAEDCDGAAQHTAGQIPTSGDQRCLPSLRAWLATVSLSCG